MSTMQKSLGTIFPAMRISFALVLLTCCIFLTAEMLGFTPQEHKFLIDSRTKISEALAIQMSILIPDKNTRQLKKIIHYISKRNPDILSAGIRLNTGELIFQSNEHILLWGDYNAEKSNTSHVLVPITQNGKLWANVELRFKSPKGDSFLGFFTTPIFRLIIFIILIGFFVYLVFILRTLRQLDPTAVIPERVNAAFNTLAEGVMIIDEDELILLANKSFCDKTGIPEKTLTGTKASQLNWKNVSSNKSTADVPWKKVLSSGKSSVGVQLLFENSKNKIIKFAINSSPIMGDKGKTLGVLLTLDDISALEQYNTDLKSAMTRLHKSQFQIKQQNKELSYLATRDALTGCLNRRAFSEQFEILFNQAKKLHTELTCMMVDIDHFKAVNDNYGHSTGDVVIKLLANILKSSSRKDDLVARYGGEEFCLVMPGMDIHSAVTSAERIRLRIKNEIAEHFKTGPVVTASLGVSSIHDNPESYEELNNLADEALYYAKEHGRNQVVRWKADEDESAKVNQSAEQNEVDESPEQPVDVQHLQNRINELEEIASNFSAQLDYQKNYDKLTGLPNQILFYDRIEQAIERGYRQNQIVAVLIIDIEMFSQVNTTLGRSIGDQLLQEFSKRLNTIFRKTGGVSRLTLSRLTGDEFAVLLTDIEQQDQVTWVVKRLLDTIDTSIEIENNIIDLNIQVGASLYPTDANTFDELLEHAMTAKKYCKDNKNQANFQFYDQHMQKLSIKNLQLEKELRAAIKNNEWELLYQPKLDINQGKIIGAEALIRWRHPQRGLLTPYEFIDFAEQHNLIIPIGDWVIQQACRQIKDLIAQGITDCKIAIKLS
ncbi:MAG: diguanylate cyclase [Gammaproteobacteria bacterium]|nr:diguanylate cyclase [Gammaproteobacteria bacterium]